MKYESYPMTKRANILIVGDSGGGKTSLLATAANAGYRVNVADFDNKLAVLNKHLTDKGRENLSVITFKDKIGEAASASKRFDEVCAKGWKDAEEDLGKITTWGPDTILAIDSLTFWGDTLKSEALAMDGKKAHEQLAPQHWGEAVRRMQNRLDLLTGDHLNCHVIMTALPQVVEDESGVGRFYPSAITANFSTKVGRYFDNVVRVYSKRDDTFWLRTAPDGRWGLKTIGNCEKEMPADLAALIEAITKNS